MHVFLDGITNTLKQKRALQTRCSTIHQTSYRDSYIRDAIYACFIRRSCVLHLSRSSMARETGDRSCLFVRSLTITLDVSS